MATKARKHGGWQDWITDRFLRGLIGLALALPWETRSRLMGWFTRRVLSPAVGYRKRAIANLTYIHPDMPGSEKRRIADAVADNAGRTMIENYDTAGLLERTKNQAITGVGLPVIEQARKDGTPVLMVTAHYANFEIPRAALVNRGFQIGGLYRPMSNPFFNEHYAENMKRLSGPVFEKGKRGTLGLIRHIAKGGFGVLLFDLHDRNGIPIPFLGKPAPTLTSAAEIAMRTGALLVPFFATRQPDGVSFEVEIEAPIAHTTPEEMTTEMTRRLEQRIATHPEQWFWIHRRWSKTL
ncbi:lysophospholipid acyltransferase family protein [Thalassovita sp.]|uniref:lysophospholipid acyltransferase family protein n=1 Tax=Thalassovita sp. TaxID=1979401 RepID=UPI0029DE8A79|nr:lysophospholipid acyltransferase family protein [Thalassovita sp.]